MPDQNNPFEEIEAQYASPSPAATQVPQNNPAQTNPAVVMTDHNPFEHIEAQYNPNVNLNSLNIIKPTTPVQPKRQYSIWDVSGEALKNALQSAYSFGRNVKNTFIHPLDTIPKLVDLIGAAPAGIGAIAGGAVLNQLSPEVRQMVIEQNPAVLQHMVDAANALGGVYKDKYVSQPGEPTFSALKRTMAEDPVGFAADASTLLAGAGGIARGVAASAPSVTAQVAARVAAPVTDAAAAASNPFNWPGAAVRTIGRGLDINDPAGNAALTIADAVVPGNGHLLPSPTQAAQNALLRNTVNGQGPEIQNALNAHQNAPITGARVLSPASQSGNIHTAAEAVAPVVTSPEFAALGRAAERRFPQQAMEIQGRNNSARLNTLNEMGQILDPNTLESINLPSQQLRQIRDTNAFNNYTIANQGLPIPLDAQIRNLLERPSMRRAMTRASQMAAERDEPFTLWPGGDNSPTMGAGQPAVRYPNGNAPTVGGGPPEVWPIAPETGNEPIPFPRENGQTPMLRVPNLHDVKMALDDQASDPSVRAQFGIGAAEVGDIRNTRNAFVNWLNRVSPDYARARSQYRIDSQNLDRKTVAEYLAARLMDPIAGEDSATQRAGNFSAAMDSALNPVTGNTTIRRSTGQQRYDSLEQLFPHSDMERLGAVQDDLTRTRLAEQQAQAGSQYGSALNNAASDTWGNMAPPVPLLRPAINFLAQNADNRIADTVGRAMLNPAEADALITNALAREAQLYRLGRGVNSLYRGATRYPAVYNMLQQDQQQKGTK